MIEGRYAKSRKTLKAYLKIAAIAFLRSKKGLALMPGDVAQFVTSQGVLDVLGYEEKNP